MEPIGRCKTDNWKYLTKICGNIIIKNHIDKRESYMVNYKDIAKEANVSTATVSRVFNNNLRISRETRNTVLKAAQRLGYIPKSGVIGENNGLSLIGFVISDSNNSFFQQLASQLEHFLQSGNCSLLVTYFESDASSERKCLENMLSLQPAVLLYIPGSDKNGDLLEKISAKGIPVLQLFTNFYKEYPAYVVDDYHSLFQAVSLLVSNGHRKIAFVENEHNFVSYKYKGYKDALEANGILFQEELIFKLPIRMDRDRILKTYIQKYRPTALITSDSVQMLLTVKTCKRIGVKIPNDLSLISIDDSDWIELFGITAIHISHDEMAYDIYSLLLKLMNEPEQMKHFYYVRQTQLVSRESIKNIQT